MFALLQPNIRQPSQGSIAMPHRTEFFSPLSISPAGQKFQNPYVTARGEERACVDFKAYQTLWFNTGTLCNLTCRKCYIESSPRNDRLVYLSCADVRTFLDEADGIKDRPVEIGFTGGEPFMNPDFLEILEETLSRGYRVLILTNAMRPMQRLEKRLAAINGRHPGQLCVRVSLDHFEPSGHEDLRGPGSWQPTIDGLMWLAASRFNVSVAGRTVWGKSDGEMRAGYARLFGDLQLDIHVQDRSKLVLFPEMQNTDDVPEISVGCWAKLGVNPSDIMCASSRMIVRRKGSDRASVVACTLLAYEEAFELGTTLDEARGSVSLNHRHCARFCVLGGASCSASK
jgi:pyruvate-formate lyase-activating enzyme